MRTLIKRFGLLVLIVLLALPLTTFAQGDPPVDGGVISAGDVVEDELTRDAPAFAYTLTVEDDQQVIVDLISDDFDCFLSVLDEDGDEIAADDDGAGNLDSRLTLTTPGTYTVVAQSYAYRNNQSGSIGAFVLSVNVSEAQIGNIEYGQRIDGELTASSLEIRYTFTGTEDDVIVAEHISEDYDSYLILERNGRELATNDDGAGNLDSRIGPFTLPDTGEYTLVVTSLSRANTGSFTVSLDLVEITEIELGEPAVAEIENEGSTLFFQFEADGGMAIDITVASKIDSTVSLIDPNGYTMISSVESANFQELTSVLLNSSGTYTLIIRAAIDETGSFEVIVDQAVLPSLNDEPQQISFSNSVFDNVLVFEAARNTTYRLTFELIEGDVGSPSIEMTQDGFSLGYTSTSRISSLSIVFTVDDAGEVVLRVTDYSYDEITYSVTLEEVGE